MTDARSVFRGLLVYSLCLPLAIVLGYMLATPLDPVSFLTIGLVLALLVTPLLLRWHHPWLVFFWNASAVISSWRPHLAVSGCGEPFVHRFTIALDRKMRPQYVSVLPAR